MSVETKTETFVIEGLDEAVPCQAEDDEGPCSREADWASRTSCCGTTWTICDPHRESYFLLRDVGGETWSCEGCGKYPMPDPTWEKL